MGVRNASCDLLQQLLFEGLPVRQLLLGRAVEVIL